MIVVGALFAGVLGVPAAAQADPSPSAPASADSKLGRQGVFNRPDAELGDGWRQSKDILVTGAGDSHGYQLYVAREKDAFAWSTLATLTASALDLGVWTGEVCVTGSGKYAVAVFAPAMAANRPKLMQAGAMAAVVDTSTGAAKTLATDVQLAYFNPGCGPDDRVLLTRSLGTEGQQTDLLAVDAAAGTVVSTRRIDAQLTNPAPGPDGDYGVVAGELVKVSESGAIVKVGKPAGTAFAVHATKSNGVDVASVRPDGAVVERFSGDAVTRLASGNRDQLQMFGLRGGGSAVVGATDGGLDAPEVTRLHSDRDVEAVSGEGHLLATSVLPRQVAAVGESPLSPAAPDAAGQVGIAVQSTRTNQSATGSVTTEPAPVLDALREKTVPPGEGAGRSDSTKQPSATKSAGVTAKPAGWKSKSAASGAASTFDVRAAALESTTLAAAEDDDWTVSMPTCAVPRNDPSIQALQASPNMVEWAVDQAVSGSLLVQRPANYLKTGRPAYQPQVMFKRHDLIGGGSVPAQVMLGIVAQESNMAQASWHAANGDLGNPLIANYYGSSTINTINYASTDCGYGIAQVTTGMRVTEQDSVYTPDQQVAIATDYAANIAAALNILIDKWNQIKSDTDAATWVNDGDPRYIENWYLALWAYNTGYYPTTDTWRAPNNGNFGLGWLNNPANPSYDPKRHAFLRRDGYSDNYDDAKVPSHWPYQERIFGWVETPQLKTGVGGLTADSGYQRANYGPSSNGHMTFPEDTRDTYLFCSKTNNCNPLEPKNTCPAVDSSCWWHGSVNFASCPDRCATEKVKYSPGSAEPQLQRYYDTACTSLSGGRDTYRDTSKPVLTVYELNDTNKYALGCSVSQSNGKFTLRFGEPSGQEGALYAPYDLHQLGAGYKGHMWFTHVYDHDYDVGAIDKSYEAKHKVAAAWTPDLFSQQTTTQRYDIVVSIPSHGADFTAAEYLTFTEAESRASKSCVINQRTGGSGDRWKYLDAADLQKGARVNVSNIAKGANGTVDIAFSAMAFIPITGQGHKCSDNYAS